MSGLSLPEVFFLALGIGGFVRFGWCLVYLIGDEEPMPAWLEKALDAAAGFVLAALAWVRHTAADGLLPLVSHIQPQKGAVR